MDTMNEYRTGLAAEAAYLVYKGCKIDDVEMSGTKGTFVFKRVPRIEILTFGQGKAQVEPYEFSQHLSEVIRSVRKKTAGKSAKR